MELENFFSLEPYNWHSVGTAVLCGFIVGLERQLRGKPVGIRTSALICLGTYIFVFSSMLITTAATDPSRVIGQVITGIGFLGAGVMLTKDGIVLGVTSAAAIWALAAIAVCIAIGHLFVAIKLAIIVVVILVGVDLFEEYSSAFTRGVHSKISRLKSKSNNQ